MTIDDQDSMGIVNLTEDIWCRDTKEKTYSFDGFRDYVTAFHGHPAPGLLLGGKMVHLALAEIPEGTLFDAITETGNCLPDAIQMLTPCTIGNGWLKVLALERFAVALYDKYSGAGTRVFIHPEKLSTWRAVDTWFLKRKPKAEQDSRVLCREIMQAGEALLEVEKIQVKKDLLKKISVGPRAVCPVCREVYPARQGASCRACQGASPYLTFIKQQL